MLSSEELNCYFHVENAGPQLPKKIRALASYREYTFAAYGHNIAVFRRAHQVFRDKIINCEVVLLLTFFFFLGGEWLGGGIQTLTN